METITKMVSERPVVIFSKTRNCAMSHTVKSLLHELGVNFAVYELDEIASGRHIEQALSRLDCNPVAPAVFIGGQLVGGANEIMSLHLTCKLKPLLIRAGALWV